MGGVLVGVPRDDGDCSTSSPSSRSSDLGEFSIINESGIISNYFIAAIVVGSVDSGSGIFFISYSIGVLTSLSIGIIGS